MTEHVDRALSLLLGSMLVIAGTASAQVNTPAAESNTTATSNTSRLMIIDIPREPTAASANDSLPQHFQEMLADPQLRQKEINRRVGQLRPQYPDFARVLRIDASTEAKVMALLADASLARDVRVLTLRDPERGQQEARSYDQRISDIAQIIGSNQLDAYLDYERTRGTHSQIQYFDASLPASSKLAAAQKDAMVPLLTAASRQQRRAARLAPNLERIVSRALLEKLTTDLRQGGTQLLNSSTIYSNENDVRLSEAADPALLEQLSRILDTEQLRRYREQQVQRVANLRSSAEQLRRDAGAGLNLPPLPAPTPTASVPNLKLQIRVRVNGVELSRIVTSARGSAVSVDGPQGLQVEIQPVGSTGQQLVVELALYEPASRGRRLVGDILGSPIRHHSAAAAGQPLTQSLRSALRAQEL
ncbi:MAG: hypothetical protein HC872_03045 [Gammaproteobacteria bacterium]|nr:hypothetical protein [Gammaproteobacteria bacterium]